MLMIQIFDSFKQKSYLGTPGVGSIYKNIKSSIKPHFNFHS
jgi:hypothetical protein